MLNFNTFGSDEWFSLSYHHSVLLLHRRRLVTKTDSEDSSFEGIDNVYLECVDSVASLCKTYRQIYLSTTVSTTWGALHVLFLGGLTFLHCLWASKKVREAYRRDTVTSICTSCTVVLVVMAERWPAAVPYRETFEALVASTQSMLVKEDLSLTAPSLPALWTTERHHIAEHLSRIEQVGMCDSVERLLNEVVG